VRPIGARYFEATLYEHDRNCPCCNRELPPGLFARVACVEAPVAVARTLGSLDGADGAISQGMIALHDRFFVACGATLPLHDQSSPVKVEVWAELDAQQFGHFLEAKKGKRRYLQAHAHLACEWPGFPGSVGAPIYVEWDAEHYSMPSVIHCVDRRISEVGRRGGFEHEDYVKLYRQVWGGPRDIANADERLRLAVIDALHELADRRQIFLKPVEPPARFAGIEPAAIVFQPPVDTGSEALLGTVGIAEAMAGNERIELVSWAQDPSEEFQKSFGDLAYWSRAPHPSLRDGVIIVEEGGVPAAHDMSGWLICSPWWRERDLPRVRVEDTIIDLLACVPISRNEQRFAEKRGPQALISKMASSDVNIFDLQRPSCL
jgi:hypothetical protein